jgi:cell division protein FtsA
MSAKRNNHYKRSGRIADTVHTTSDLQSKPQPDHTVVPAMAIPAAIPQKHKDLLFALDIGTRSVIGIVAEPTDKGLKIIATERQEHKTRAMLDGQIHDVPQVAAILESVKKALEQKVGLLKHAAVAAAGRALYTMTADAALETDGIITAAQERDLDFSGVQAAQHKLASSNTIDDPTLYYCVGYSTVKYTLDGTQLKTLVGQRGKTAVTTVIATFLPRQVIDSMQSALRAAKLDMRALTLEPIAAINVLIPPTMRHLNLVLVDIGAGTSDVAITKNGSVIAYGMVPLAGDEITEAISQQYLLDFNIAEQVKRDIANGKGATFCDILGIDYNLSSEEVINTILPNVTTLADAIGKQILALNGTAPQAVLLVGGGSLTPRLPELVAKSLNLPGSRVAVRRPEAVDGIELIPPDLCSPDAVTPLGILKIASINTLHFLSVFVNNEEYSLFNFRELTLSDALLNAGISLRKFNGHPGLGLMLTVNGTKKFIPGTMGTLAKLTLDDAEATLDSVIANDSHIMIEPGVDGLTPQLCLSDVIDLQSSMKVRINDKEIAVAPLCTINNEAADLTSPLHDNDIVEAHETRSIGELLHSAGFDPTGRKFKYTLNGTASTYNVPPKICVHGEPVTLSAEINEKDEIEYIEPNPPKLGDVLNISELETSMIIYFNKNEYKIPAAGVELEINGHKATINTFIDDGSDIRYHRSERKAAIVSDVLLAVGFQPPAPTSRVTFNILVNNKPTEFTAPIKNGDAIDVIIKPLGENSSIQHKRE